MVPPDMGVRTLTIVSATEIRSGDRIEDTTFVARTLGIDPEEFDGCTLWGSDIWRFVPPG